MVIVRRCRAPRLGEPTTTQPRRPTVRAPHRVLDQAGLAEQLGWREAQLVGRP
jgi:hypothetical protein